MYMEIVNMRSIILYIFLILLIVEIICGYKAYKSIKPIGKDVCKLLLSFLPPVLGNFIIIATENELVATIGYYIYFLGMDLVVYFLYKFSVIYCGIENKYKKCDKIINFLLLADLLQYIINIFTHHAFTIEKILLEGNYSGFYYRLVTNVGQTYHRIICYGLFIVSIVIFGKKSIRSSIVMSERYIVIFLSMLLAGLWQTFYIFSRTPIDLSMIGFIVFSIIVYYFALYYKSVYLLNSMLANLAYNFTDSVFVFDELGGCIWVNNDGIKLLDLYYLNDYGIVGERLKDFLGFSYIESKEEFHKDITVRIKELKYYIVDKKFVKDSKNRKLGFFIYLHDNTEERNALIKEKYNSIHDTLTGLYTKEYLYEIIEKRIHEDKENQYLILFFDINNFKLVNDVFGKEFGDYTLKEMGNWFKNKMGDKGFYGRIAGDLFGACMKVSSFNEENLKKELENFYVKDSVIEYPLLIHVGIYIIENIDIPISIMFDWAHLAIKSIKNDYQVHIAYYDKEVRDKVLWDQKISIQLSDAIKNKEIQPYLQPILDKDKKVVGAEVLVRWIHPEYGFMPPALFIPYFEANGMIAKLDKYMWECACQILAQWKKDEKDLFLSINVSPKDFYFMDVAEEICNLVKKYNVSENKLRVEITETVMETDVKIRLQELNILRQKGFIIEMDDFGSGYSSLNLLKDMPIDVLKIDMVFLKKSENEKKAEKILHNIVNMSEDLDIVSLIEGVETESQYDILSEMGCKMFQGYYFVKPMPLQDFQKYIE